MREDFQLIECDYGGERLCSFFSAVASVASAGIQASAAKDAADLQAESAENAFALQREVFETSRQDLAPFSQVGLGALNELSRLFLGTDSPAALQNATNGGLSRGPLPPEFIAERRAVGGDRGETGFEGFDGRGGGANVSQQRFENVEVRNPAFDEAVAARDAFGTFTPGQLSTDERLSNFFTSPDFTFRRDEGEKAIDRALAARGLSNSGTALRGLTEFNSNLAAGEFNTFANRLTQLAGIGQDATSQGVNLAQNFANSAGQDILDAGTARASGVAGSANALTGGLSNLSNIFEGRNFFSGFNSTPTAPARFGAGSTPILPPQTNALAGIF